MKSTLLSILFVLSNLLAQCQVNFDAYNSIINPSFEGFVALFSQKNLPLSADIILAEQDLQNPTAALIPSDMIDEFLKEDGVHLISKLYDIELEDGQPDYTEMGAFYPLYKLPTDGDYVMLVVSQADPYGSFDRVHVMTFDLSGQFISFINTLYAKNSIDINNKIDINLKSYYNYVLYEVAGQDTDPPRDRQFNGFEANSVYQVTSDGQIMKDSFTKTPGDFMWETNEKRYKRVN